MEIESDQNQKNFVDDIIIQYEEGKLKDNTIFITCY